MAVAPWTHLISPKSNTPKDHTLKSNFQDEMLEYLKECKNIKTPKDKLDYV